MRPALKPFFTYYGGKWRVAPKYPTPAHERIIEPFAGSAGYSLRYPGRDVWLNDMDPLVAGTWEYLIGVSEAEILSLPDVAEGQTVDDFDLCQEAKWLIGWWLNKGSASPGRQPTTFMLKYPQGGPYWGEGIRNRIASQIGAIRHWTVTQGDYADLPNVEATWFIDPPYERAGRRYRCGSDGIDFPALGEWCRSRRGQVLVCEADQADWLPFQPLAVIDGTEGRQKKTRARVEVLWTSTPADDEGAA